MLSRACARAGAVVVGRNAGKVGLAGHKTNRGREMLWRTARALSSGEEKDREPPKKSLLDRLLGPESNWAEDSSINRWLMAIPPFLTHMCIGSPYAWSSVSGTLSRELGVVASAADDWSLGAVTAPISIVFFMQGIIAAMAGNWQVRVGPRMAMAVAAGCFGGGLALAAAGVATHNLALVYAGYGVLGGTGVGLAYTPPLQALMDWFPDRRGLASGIVIAGFGSGALAFSPAVSALKGAFSKPPRFLGPKDQVSTTEEGGRLFAEVDGNLQEVVLARAKDLAKLDENLATLNEGYYLVGSGSTGAAQALGILGAAYFAAMMTGSLSMKRPPKGYTVKTEEKKEDFEGEKETTKKVNFEGEEETTKKLNFEEESPKKQDFELGPTNTSLPPHIAVKTPQFWLLSSTFGLMAAGGLGLLSVAKPMMSEVFTNALPTVATSAFASSFVMWLAAGNLAGRIVWSSVSDKIGRRNTFFIFTGATIPVFLSLPYFVEQAISSNTPLPLYGFIGSCVLAVSMMGGVYAALPAYEGDLFGPKHVGPIHGRNLLASSAAALLGPSLFLGLRQKQEHKELDRILADMDPQHFQQSFHAPIDRAHQLFDSKTINLQSLAEAANAPDPSPFLYDSSMYTLAALASAAALTHAAIRPVNQKFFKMARDEKEKAKQDQTKK